MENSEIINRLQRVVRFLEGEMNIDSISDAHTELEHLKEHIGNILQDHWNIQCSDDQYSDPEMWTLEPVYDTIVPSIEKLAWICNWFDDDYGLDDTDEENIQTVITNLKICIKDL